MKRTALILILPLFGLFFTGCYPVSQSIDAFRAPTFKADASFKVVSLNTNDQVLIALEQQLLSQGFKVIADNYLRTQSAPAGNVTITTNDTTYNTMQYRPLGVEIFKDKQADYVVRYDMNWRLTGSFFEYFNASVVNTVTGAVEFTYNFRQGSNSGDLMKNMRFVLRDFVTKMLAAK
jgi:hypothetical protein